MAGWAAHIEPRERSWWTRLRAYIGASGLARL
jgi:hypothetical protein